MMRRRKLIGCRASVKSGVRRDAENPIDDNNPAYYMPAMENTGDPAKSLGFLLHDASRLLRRRFESEAAGMPMTAAQMRIVARLMRHEGASQAALAGILEIEPMTLCRHVDRMEAAGLVERRQDPSDRRARQLFTTAQGRAALAPMRARAASIYEEALTGLSERERDALIATLETIIANLSVTQGAERALPTGPSAQENA